MMDDVEYGAIGGKLGRGNRLIGKKPILVMLHPSQILHYLTRARTGAAEVGSRWLTALATARRVPITAFKNVTICLNIWFYYCKRKI
jgi:hypothetical protein